MRERFVISEGEKNKIRRLHESITPKRYLEKTDTSSVYCLVNQFIDELNFQKQIHLQTISMIEENQREKYISNMQRKRRVKMD